MAIGGPSSLHVGSRRARSQPCASCGRKRQHPPTWISSGRTCPRGIATRSRTPAMGTRASLRRDFFEHGADTIPRRTYTLSTRVALDPAGIVSPSASAVLIDDSCGGKGGHDESIAARRPLRLIGLQLMASAPEAHDAIAMFGDKTRLVCLVTITPGTKSNELSSHRVSTRNRLRRIFGQGPDHAPSGAAA